MPGPIAVYFDFPSVHSYLGLAQLQEVAARHGRAIDWRPISLMDLWKAHDYMPLGNPIAKGRYIKKDFMPPRRSKWIRAPVEGRIEAFHAGLDAAWGAERWKRGRYSRSGLA